MKLGLSLTPGGLLLPYHLGVLDSLQHHEILTDHTPIAGSSAGAIATAAYACGLNSRDVLDLTVDMSAEGARLGGTRGRLLPLLRTALTANIGPSEWSTLQHRPGAVGIAYRQVFPCSRKILQTEFASPEDLINSVCYSSMFPFFSTNWPATFMRDHENENNRRQLRLAVDGFFTVPRDRFGAPELDTMYSSAAVAADGSSDYDHGDSQTNNNIDRTVAICPFPKDKIRLDAFQERDCITAESIAMGNLVRMATEGSNRAELTALYETGYEDGETWVKNEKQQQ